MSTDVVATPREGRRISKGAQRRAEKVNPIMTEYQLGCIKRHFDRLQRGFSNRRAEYGHHGRTSKSKPGYRPSRAKIESSMRGADIINLFVRRGMRLSSKKVYRKPLVTGIKRALSNLMKR